MIPFSVLDLSPVPEGTEPGGALRNTLDLAQHAESWGYKRFWLAEHHNMPGIASAATAVAIGYVAGGTTTIRVGAGGIMLPNHAPLIIAEQFGTLESLYPGRIDLGLGRAPGTDPATTQAIRRGLMSDPESFPRDVIELMEYFRDAEPSRRVQAIPGTGLNVPIWILGSSHFGAQLAAALGLPYAFASHFAPELLMSAIATYRSAFRPSPQLGKPHIMLGFNVFAAATDAEAKLLYSSLQQAFIHLRHGRPGRLPPPLENMETRLADEDRQLLQRFLACSAIGSPDTVRRSIEDFIERTSPDELMITGQIFDHAARLRSFEIVAEISRQL